MIIESMRAFWMEYGEIIVLLSAAVTLIGVVLSLFKSNSISEKAVNRTETAECLLSSQHSHLEASQTVLLERAADAKETLNAMKTSFDNTRESILNESVDRKLQYSSLSDTQKLLKDSADNMGKFAGEFARVVAENVALTKTNEVCVVEIKQQQQQIQQLREENAHLKGKLIVQKPHQYEHGDYEQDMF